MRLKWRGMKMTRKEYNALLYWEKQARTLELMRGGQYFATTLRIYRVN